MNSSEYGYVYIHGAGLDTWIWDEMSHLRDTATLSASFPGRTNDDSNVGNSVGLQDYINLVSRQVEEWPVEKAILVSHSIGGIIGLGVADKLPEKVIGFVGVCAAIPSPGNSFFACYPFHQRVIQEVIIHIAGTKPPDSAIRGSLCAGLSEEHTSRIIEGFTPEQRRLFTDDHRTETLEIPTLYVRTMNDKEFPSSLQDSMIDNLSPDDVHSINSGHLPMLSEPDQLMDILDPFTKNWIL